MTAKPAPITVISTEEFNRALSRTWRENRPPISQNTSFHSDNESSAQFDGTHDQFKLVTLPNGLARIVNRKSNKAVTSNFGLGSTFDIFAVDMDNNGADEIYVRQSGVNKFIAFDLSGVKGVPHSAWETIRGGELPYDFDFLWDGCGTSDWGTRQYLQVSPSAHKLTISGQGRTFYLTDKFVASKDNTASAENGSVFIYSRIKFLFERMIQCGIEMASDEQSRTEWTGVLWTARAATSRWEEVEGPLVFHDDSFELQDGDAEIHIYPALRGKWLDNESVVFAVGVSFGFFSDVYYVNRAGWVFSVDRSGNYRTNPVPDSKKREIERLLNGYLTANAGTDPRREETIRSILDALHKPPHAWMLKKKTGN